MDIYKYKSVRYCARKLNSGEIYNKDCFLEKLYRIIPESNIKTPHQYTTTDLQIETLLNYENTPQDTILKIAELGGETKFHNGVLWIYYRIPNLMPLIFTGFLYLFQAIFQVYCIVYHRQDLDHLVAHMQATLGMTDVAQATSAA